MSATFTCQAQVLTEEFSDRAPVAIPVNASTNFISWRMFPTDDSYTTFDVLRNGEPVSKDLNTVTSVMDTDAGATPQYQIVTKHKGVPTDTTKAFAPWKDKYLKIPLIRPAGGTFHSAEYTYGPADCSTGDADGDGQLELFVKWDPSECRDNSQGGYTGPCIIDCYKLDGTRLWQVNLGHNIRSGAHYTQFMVYDFDGDGKAEMICKTAPGSVDGRGHYVSEAATDKTILSVNNTADLTNGFGNVLDGQEYLTVFSGLTGEALHTVFYNPNRGGYVGGAPSGSSESFWGDGYGNRCDRFLACVGYVNGFDHRPNAVMVRGYYTHCYVWAVEFDGKELTTSWLHHSSSTSEYSVKMGKSPVKSYKNTYKTFGSGFSATAFYNGNHNISVADVDGDGKDEILLGGSTIDHDGTLLYATGMGHGDAMHLSDLDPDRPGLEMFVVHESSPYGMSCYDACTGEKLFHMDHGKDTGRGLAGDINESRGQEFWSSAGAYAYNAKGQRSGSKGASQCFRIYWNGDVYDEMLEGGTVLTGYGTKLAHNGMGYACNGTKNTPNLSADLFGDWREELVLHDDNNLYVMSSVMPTSLRFPTLLSDHVYRMGIAWQNTCYNQPPHLGYYLPDSVKTGFEYPNGKDLNVALGDSLAEPLRVHIFGATSANITKTIQPDKTTVGNRKAPEGMRYTYDATMKECIISGTPKQIGTYLLIFKTSGAVTGVQISDTCTITVCDPSTSVHSVLPKERKTGNRETAFFISGLPAKDDDKGIVIRNGRKTLRK